MSNKFNQLFLVPILATTLMGGVILYLAGFEGGINIKIVTIVALSLLLQIIPVYRSYKNGRDAKLNRPLEDEMSGMLEVHAGAYAFGYSMMSWFLIFLLRSKSPDNEEMLGIGIPAAGAIYGLCWFYFKLNGLPNANQD